MFLYTREKTSTHPNDVLTNENTKYLKNASIHPCLIVTGTRERQPVSLLGHAEVSLFLCVNKAFRVLTVPRKL